MRNLTCNNCITPFTDKEEKRTESKTENERERERERRKDREGGGVGRQRDTRALIQIDRESD